jgi:hypothetical protein
MACPAQACCLTFLTHRCAGDPQARRSDSGNAHRWFGLKAEALTITSALKGRRSRRLAPRHDCKRNDGSTHETARRQSRTAASPLEGKRLAIGQPYASHRQTRVQCTPRVSPTYGDQEGCAAPVRAAPLFAPAVCTRAKSLAAMPFSCKREAESDDLEPEADVVARGAKGRQRWRDRSRTNPPAPEVRGRVLCDQDALRLDDSYGDEARAGLARGLRLSWRALSPIGRRPRSRRRTTAFALAAPPGWRPPWRHSDRQRGPRSGWSPGSLDDLPESSPGSAPAFAFD